MQLAEERLRSGLVASALNQNIEPMATLIHGSPEVVAIAMNRENHLVQMPLVAWLRTLAPQLIGLWLAECATPHLLCLPAPSSCLRRPPLLTGCVD
jgi:hypothetical protein